MAKRSKKKKAIRENTEPTTSDPKSSRPKSAFGILISHGWLPLLLAAVTFLVYWPSLYSDFVYDARIEILDEGYITSLSNLPDVLSLKVLGMNLTLGTRPGSLLYLMLIAAVCGAKPFGYHLCSNLLHAANVALLYVLLHRLVTIEMKDWIKRASFKIQLSVAAVVLIFALHPLAVEPVADVSYCSDLLVTFFTLLALLTATAFNPQNFRSAMTTGAIGTLCAFASVTCKESGLAVAGLLIVYWFLFRRNEAKAPWLLFLGTCVVVTVAFLTARFLLAPANPNRLTYLGGSFFHVFLIQPRLWVFMMGKLLWPTQLSADYTMENLDGLSTAVALPILAVVVLLQVWLAMRSRLGFLGVAIYWLGLATVSNFIPLYRPLADRFYYWPLTGVAMQLLALLLMLLKSCLRFWMTELLIIGTLLSLTYITLIREDVFFNDFSLSNDTIQVSPFSATAHNNLGVALDEQGKIEEAIVQYQKALELNPNFIEAYTDLANALVQQGKIEEAMVQYRKALELNPDLFAVRYNLGIVLLNSGQINEAMTQLQMALKINPTYPGIYCNLGNALLIKGRADEAIAEYRKGLEINPNNANAHFNLGVALAQKGQLAEAIAQYKEALKIDPHFSGAHNKLGIDLAQKGQLDGAITEFQKALEIDPKYVEAYNNLGNALLLKGQINEALVEYREALRLNPDYRNAQDNLAKAKAMLAQKTAPR